MSLLSKLLGSKGKDLLNDLADAIKQEAKKEEHPERKDQKLTVGGGSVTPIPEEDLGPSGFSWGPVMPDEENQFNYPGPYYEYFEKIYKEEFPEYRIEKTSAERYPATIFHFFRGEQRVLTVEVISRKSDVKKLRRDCYIAGVKYLRYYYDYEGWWNTRAYVVKRTREALEG